jgi:preprotein translocase subunit SecE
MAIKPLTFGKEAYDELKKVTWPTRPEVIRLTITVIAVSIFVAIFLGVIDLFFEKLIEGLITR